MNYFMGIVFCVATVSAEAIPDALTLSPVESFFYERACKRLGPLKNEPLEPTSSVKPIVPNVPDVVLHIPAEPEAKPTPSVKPIVPNVPDVVLHIPAKPAAKPTTSVVPDVILPVSLTPVAKPTPSVVPPVSSTSLPKPPEPKPATQLPGVMPVITSPEVEAAKARAIALYGKEPGFAGVTNRIVTTRDGRRFLYINIKPDGNCGFYASAIDRSTFVATIKELVNEQHDVFQAFVNERTALVGDIDDVMPDDDKKAIAARVQDLHRLADNGRDLAPALKLLTDFESEKKKYQAELFVDARNRLIKNLQDLEDLPTVRAQIGSLIGVLASVSVYGVDVKALSESYNALVPSLTSLTQVKMKVKQIQDAFKELMVVCGYSDVALFEKAKLRMMNKIQALTTMASYEAFLTALKQELIASGVIEADFANKEKLLKSVESVFSKNRGSGTWIPGGLLAPIAQKLRIEYNIWASDVGGFIKLYSSSGDGRGVPATGANVRNVFFTGGHYDMLIPMGE